MFLVNRMQDGIKHRCNVWLNYLFSPRRNCDPSLRYHREVRLQASSHGTVCNLCVLKIMIARINIMLGSEERERSYRGGTRIQTKREKLGNVD